MRFATGVQRALVLALAAGFLAGATGLRAQDKLARRYGFDVNPSQFPQKSPQEALLSIAKAIENRRIGYLMAQLADPAFVDETVAQYKTQITKGGDEARTFLAFDRLVDETTAYFLEDPSLVKELRRFGKDDKADWKIEEATAEASLKDIQGRKVFLRKIEERWFLENRQQ